MEAGLSPCVPIPGRVANNVAGPIHRNNTKVPELKDEKDIAMSNEEEIAMSNEEETAMSNEEETAMSNEEETAMDDAA